MIQMSILLKFLTNIADNYIMKTWELVKDFQLKFPNLVKDLIANSHHWDDQKLNSFHIEAPSTWAHCMMVCLMAEHYRENLVVRISALCHDLSKPMSTTRAEDKKRIRMFGHESSGIFLTLDYLKTLDFLSNEEKVRICQLVCFHTYLYQEMRKEGYEEEVAKFFLGEKDLFTDLISLTRADALGRFAENESREIWENAHETFAPVLHKINPTIYPRQTQGEAIILVGPPMSGKSTWIKSNATANHLVVCRDQVIMDMAKGKDYNEAYRSVDQDKVNQQYDLLRKDALKSGKDLIFDLTHMTEKSRRKSLAGLPKNMKRRAVVFLTGYETLKTRNEVRAKKENKRIPDYVLQNMMGQFVMPMRSEGFDEIEYVFSK